MLTKGECALCGQTFAPTRRDQYYCASCKAGFRERLCIECGKQFSVFFDPEKAVWRRRRTCSAACASLRRTHSRWPAGAAMRVCAHDGCETHIYYGSTFCRRHAQPKKKKKKRICTFREILPSGQARDCKATITGRRYCASHYHEARRGQTTKKRNGATDACGGGCGRTRYRPLNQREKRPVWICKSCWTSLHRKEGRRCLRCEKPLRSRQAKGHHLACLTGMHWRKPKEAAAIKDRLLGGGADHPGGKQALIEEFGVSRGFVDAMQKELRAEKELVTGKCRRCGMPVSRKSRLCRACLAELWATKRVKVTCPQCQIEAAAGLRDSREIFTRELAPSRLKQSPRHFCSHAHERAYLNHRERRCEQCGTKFHVRPKWKERFCSTACSGAWDAEHSPAAARIGVAYQAITERGQKPGIRELARVADASTNTVYKFLERLTQTP